MSCTCNVGPVQHGWNPAPTHPPQWWTIHTCHASLEGGRTGRPLRETPTEIAKKYSQFIQVPFMGRRRRRPMPTLMRMWLTTRKTSSTQAPIEVDSLLDGTEFSLSLSKARRDESNMVHSIPTKRLPRCGCAGPPHSPTRDVPGTGFAAVDGDSADSRPTALSSPFSSSKTRCEELYTDFLFPGSLWRSASVAAAS